MTHSATPYADFSRTTGRPACPGSSGCLTHTGSGSVPTTPHLPRGPGKGSWACLCSASIMLADQRRFTALQFPGQTFQSSCYKAEVIGHWAKNFRFGTCYFPMRQLLGIPCWTDDPSPGMKEQRHLAMSCSRGIKALCLGLISKCGQRIYMKNVLALPAKSFLWGFCISRCQLFHISRPSLTFLEAWRGLASVK